MKFLLIWMISIIISYIYHYKIAKIFMAENREYEEVEYVTISDIVEYMFNCSLFIPLIPCIAIIYIPVFYLLKNYDKKIKL